ncbi:family 43 glycosylhydrolase [Bacteroides intestinalis]|uniref:family 43 glycosylhydrolase n=1 Tax=Bacteroides intestinalis TaxID=329854 RepID=UPI00189E8571|nr:family 43 glycosylhydrolase [Bacteroides intestinalis]
MKNKLSLLLVSFFLFSCAENKQVAEQQTTFCNPMNLDYGWGCFQKREKKARTAADPVIVLFKDKYYLFTTMDIGGYRVSDDLITWKDVYFNPEIHASALDIDHYVAPAVAADDNYVYFINFTRDRSKKKVDVIRSADPENGKWEKCGEVRRMADPCLFIDDGRFYFYYGLGAEQSTTFFEVNPETFEEIEGTKKVLREYITDVKECTSGYHFGRRELYDEIDASAWMGKFEKIPCPEGAWIVKNNDKYYLQYATPGTICNWYCDIVMESDSANGGFVEQPYNPVSLKVGGFIGGAGHSCVFKDKYGNWWQATSMWIGNHDEFERRIGLFPVSFDAKGRMRTHTVLGDYPMLLPQKKFEPQDISAFGWMLQSFNKACMASSSLPGFEPEKAADENVRTWWSAESGNAGEHFVMNFGKKVQINSVQINFAEQDINPEAPKETDYHAYKLYTSNDGHTWKLLADKSGNKTAVPHEYLELSGPVEASYMKVENVHTPKEGKFALLDLRVFGSGYSDKPGQVKELSVERNQEDERYASLAWNKVSGADGYLVRFGYQPDFLNQCIQVKGNETTELLLHILTKGVKYYYRVDTYNDSGITEGNVISE